MAPCWARPRTTERLPRQVQRGGHGTRCVKWITTTTDTDQRSDTADEQRRVLIPRVFAVLNVAQVDGYQPATDDTRTPPDRIEAADRVAGVPVGRPYSVGQTSSPDDPSNRQRREAVDLGQALTPIEHLWPVAPEVPNQSRAGVSPVTLALRRVGVKQNEDLENALGKIEAPELLDYCCILFAAEGCAPDPIFSLLYTP